MADPIRFERTTSAFGEISTRHTEGATEPATALRSQIFQQFMTAVGATMLRGVSVFVLPICYLARWRRYEPWRSNVGASGSVR